MSEGYFLVLYNWQSTTILWQKKQFVHASLYLIRPYLKYNLMNDPSLFFIFCISSFLKYIFLIKYERTLLQEFHENGYVTCPCMFMMTMVFDLLHTMNCSVCRGRGCTLCTVMSIPEVPPRDLNVFWHSVVFRFHTFTVPSELAL